MTVAKRFGVPTLINAAGAKTRLGGVRPLPEVVVAMAEASDLSMDVAYLQDAASSVIARVTGAEAGCVTSGAAAALTLAAAACIAGDDPVRIDALPHLNGKRDEIVIARRHRNSYDHAWRAAGARLVEVGIDDRDAGSGMRGVEPWEYEAAFGPETAAVAYVARAEEDPPLREVVDVAHRHGVPVIVDAAARLPPVSNLRAFIDAGADLVAYSGGKALRGPQASGILCGRADLLRAALLSQLDMDQPVPHWTLPPGLFPDASRRPLPRHGVARGMKVGKEQVLGLLVALEAFASEDPTERVRVHEERLSVIKRALEGTPVVEVRDLYTPERVRLAIRFSRPDEALDVYEDLLHGERPIAVDPAEMSKGVLVVDPLGLSASEAEEVARAFARAIVPSNGHT